MPVDVGPKSWIVYMIETAGGKFYTGITTDKEKRWKEHSHKFYQKKGKGARFFLFNCPLRYSYWEMALNRSEASRREREIKKYSHQKKWQMTQEFFIQNKI